MPPKRNQAKLNAQLRDLKGITEELKKESDRAAVIVGAAYLDEHLREYLTSFLADTKTVDQLFDVNQPLGAFGARIQIAYCLGLLCPDEYHDFRVVQDIRNTFAHQLHGLSFADTWVATRCRGFAIPQKALSQELYQTYSPRDLFLLVFYDLNASMATEQFNIHQQNKRCAVPGPRHWRQTIPTDTEV